MGIRNERTSLVQIPLSDCRTGSVIRGEFEAGNHSLCHCDNYASGVPLEEEEELKKTLNIRRGERKIDEDMQGVCTRMCSRGNFLVHVLPEFQQVICLGSASGGAV